MNDRAANSSVPSPPRDQIVGNQRLMGLSPRPQQWLLGLLLLLLLGLRVSTGRASPEEILAIQTPWWTVSLPSRSCPGTSDTSCHYSSPALADVNGDGRLDVVVATNRGRVLAISHNGAVLWNTDIAPYFGMGPDSHSIASSPAVGDVDNDGLPEIVVGAGSLYGSHCTHGGVIVLNHNGAPQSGWPQLTADADNNGCRDTIFASPAIGDLDNDGYLEVVAAGFDKRIYAWRHNGALLPGFPPSSNHRHRFPTWQDFVGRLGDTIWGSPVLADLNLDGHLDIVVGTDEGNYDASWGGNAGGWMCPYALPPGWPPGYCGGSIYALDRFGNVLPGFPRYYWETIQSTPAVANVLGDARPEIFIGTGTFYHVNSPDHPSHGFRVYGLDASGNDLPGWSGGKSVGGGVPASPVLGNITGDAGPEVIVAANDRRLYAWHLNGQPVSGFPMTPRDHLGNNFSTFDAGTSFVLADYDNDGRMEIFLNEGWSIVIVDGNGQQLTATNWPGGDQRPVYNTNGSLLNTPAVGDLDNDGRLELVVSNSGLLVWKMPHPTTAADWPMFKLNQERTGASAAPPRLESESGPVVLFHQNGSGSSAVGYITIHNDGQNSLSWSSSAPSGVNRTPSSGALSPGGYQVIRLNMNAQGYNNGAHNLGNLTINASDEGGNPAVGSPLSTPITLIVGSIRRVSLPAVMR